MKGSHISLTVTLCISNHITVLSLIYSQSTAAEADGIIFKEPLNVIETHGPDISALAYGVRFSGGLGTA